MRKQKSGSNQHISMNTERWLSMDEIAMHLGVSEDTIHRWIRLKSMPAHKVGRLWKFRTSQIDKWVESGKASPRMQDK